MGWSIADDNYSMIDKVIILLFAVVDHPLGTAVHKAGVAANNAHS